MGLFGRGTSGSGSASVPVRRGERVLATAPDADRGTVVATTYDVAYLTPDGALRWRRPWHLIDTGSWSQSEESLLVTWMDEVPVQRWQVAGHTRFLTVFRERVQASVVLGSDVEVAGRRVARVVLRKDLATGELLDQVKWRRGVRARGSAADDAAEAVARALAGLRDDVGLS